MTLKYRNYWKNNIVRVKCRHNVNVKNEHKSENLPRGTEFSIKQKANLEHYRLAKIIIEHYK